MLECMRNRGLNENGIVKRGNDGKEGWVENCGNGMSLVLQIWSKTLNPNMSFKLHYNPKPNPIPNLASKQPLKELYLKSLFVFKNFWMPT